MSDPTLQRIWHAREALARRFDYDSRKRVRYYQHLDEADEQVRESKRKGSGVKDRG